MKRLFFILFSMTFLVSSLAQAQTMGHGVQIQAEKTDKNVAIIISNPAGKMGEIILSPEDNEKTNLTYTLGKQKVHIKKVSINSKQKITIDGRVSDTQGVNKISFNQNL